MSESAAEVVDQQVWSTLVGRTDRELAGLIAANHVDLLVREARVLLLAAAWADAHDVDAASPEYRPLVSEPARGAGSQTALDNLGPLSRPA